MDFYIGWLLALLTGTDRPLCSKLSFFIPFWSRVFPTLQPSSHGISYRVEISTHSFSQWAGGEKRQFSSLVLLQARPLPESRGHQGTLPGKTSGAVPLSPSWGFISPHKTFCRLQTRLDRLCFLIPVFQLYGYIEITSVGIWNLILWQNHVKDRDIYIWNQHNAPDWCFLVTHSLYGSPCRSVNVRFPAASYYWPARSSSEKLADLY